MSKRTSILFICMGNICRSPTAEGVFRKLIADRGVAHLFEVDSAGTHAYHIGNPPDRRSIDAAKRRGIDLTTLRARKVEPADFQRFHLLLAMDEENLALLHGMAAPEEQGRVKLYLEYARRNSRREVPDPYYGGANGFEDVLDLVEDAAEGLLESLLP